MCVLFIKLLFLGPGFNARPGLAFQKALRKNKPVKKEAHVCAFPLSESVRRGVPPKKTDSGLAGRNVPTSMPVGEDRLFLPPFVVPSLSISTSR